MSGSRGLARQLLLCGSMLGLGFQSIGCVIPVPLDQAPPQSGGQPTILIKGESPPFGPISHQNDDVFGFSILVEDPNLDDVLLARLMRPSPSGTGRTQIESDVTLTSTGSASSPTQRGGTFMPLPYCDVLNVVGTANMVGTVTLYVRVSNQPFSTNPTTPEATDGLFDEQLWLLTCSQ